MPQNGKTKRGAPSKRQTKPQPGRGANLAQTKAPVAKSRNVRTNAPAYLNAPGGSVRVRHREFLWDIVGSVEFAWDEFAINPGVPETFPWLSAIAARFESYKFHSLRFCYEPAVSTTTPGTVILAVDYDASDIGPETKTVALSYRGAVRAAPWDECAFIAQQDDLHKAKSNYVRSGLAPSGTDIKMYDVGNLYVATQGQAAATAVGELYVEYDVELMTPQLNADAPTLDLVNLSGVGVATNALFGTPASVVENASHGLASNIAYSIPDPATLRFEQAGTYLLEAYVAAATSTTFQTLLTQGVGFAKQIGAVGFSSTPAAATIANWVVKANRGDLFRPLLTIVGAASRSAVTITRVAAAAA